MKFFNLKQYALQEELETVKQNSLVERRVLEQRMAILEQACAQLRSLVVSNTTPFPAYSGPPLNGTSAPYYVQGYVSADLPNQNQQNPSFGYSAPTVGGIGIDAGINAESIRTAEQATQWPWPTPPAPQEQTILGFDDLNKQAEPVRPDPARVRENERMLEL